MTELLPCPFCGGEAKIVGSVLDGFFAYCPNCGAGAVRKNEKAEAIEAWNTRYERTCKNIKDQLHRIGATEFMCSECRAYYADAEAYYAYLSCDDDEREVKTNYCPNCGAKVVD